MENFYEILQCGPDATTAELRKKYLELVRKYHPDKQNPEEELTRDDFCTAYNHLNAWAYHTFGLVDTAWQTLSDPEKRKQYDQKWKDHQALQEMPSQGEISSKELLFDDDEEVYKADCRCGGHYVISEEDMLMTFDYVTCDTCSLTIKIIPVFDC